MQKPAETKPRRAHYDREFKKMVVDHLLTSGKSMAVVAKEFGVNHWVLRDWKRHYAPEQRVQSAPIAESPESMRSEIQRLRQELERVTRQREILKKTLGIISEL